MNIDKLHGFVTRFTYGDRSWRLMPMSEFTGADALQRNEWWQEGWDHADTIFVEGMADICTMAEWVASYVNELEYQAQCDRDRPEAQAERLVAIGVLIPF
jgi:hypothetical protein